MWLMDAVEKKIMLILVRSFVSLNIHICLFSANI
jgi:hypothetical protein